MLQKEECSFFLLQYEEFPNSIQKFLNTISMSKQHVMLANQIEIVQCMHQKRTSGSSSSTSPTNNKTRRPATPPKQTSNEEAAQRK